MDFWIDTPLASARTTSYTLQRGTKFLHIAKMTKFVNINDMSTISNKKKCWYLLLALAPLVSSSIKLMNHKVINGSLLCWIPLLPPINQQTTNAWCKTNYNNMLINWTLFRFVQQSLILDNWTDGDPTDIGYMDQKPSSPIKRWHSLPYWVSTYDQKILEQI